MHPSKIPFTTKTLSIFHLERSGNDIKDVQYRNTQLKSVTLLGLHFEISSNDNNEEQLYKEQPC